MADSVAARYYVTLRDYNGVQVALFDHWTKLDFGLVVNDVGYYTMSLTGTDPKVALFQLDGLVEIHRSVPGCDLPFYREFAGLQISHRMELSEDGVYTFTSSGVTAEELLSRRIIGYDAGTIRADKDAPAETAMKEYVEENCGETLDWTVVGRFANGLMPGFSVEGTSGAGPNWQGSMAYENLLDALQTIAGTAKIDFWVEVGETGARTYTFRTRVNQLGEDRTQTGLNTATGVNAAGNVPVIFAPELGNVSNIYVEEDHSKEANVVIVLGEGDGSTRETFTRTDELERVLSPWNSREVSRSGGNQEYDYQYEQAGDDELVKSRYKEKFEFEPLQTPECLYGKHYFFGDKVTIRFGTVTRDKRITGVKISVDEQDEHIALEMSEDAQ